MGLAAQVFALAPAMPTSERFGMSSQMQRAVASVPASIAEGYQRGTRKDYARFISIARRFLAETETFLRPAVRVGYLSAEVAQPSLELADALGRMLTTLKRRLDGPALQSS